MSVLLLIMLYYFLCKLCGFCNACWLFCIYFYVVVHWFGSEFLFVQHFKSWDTDIFRNYLDLIKIQLIFHEKIGTYYIVFKIVLAGGVAWQVFQLYTKFRNFSGVFFVRYFRISRISNLVINFLDLLMPICSTSRL